MTKTAMIEIKSAKMVIAPCENTELMVSMSEMVRVLRLPIGVLSKYCNLSDKNLLKNTISKVFYDILCQARGRIIEYIFQENLYDQKCKDEQCHPQHPRTIVGHHMLIDHPLDQ